MGIPTREQAVWARVMAASAQAPMPLPEPMHCPPKQQEAPGLSPETVLSMIADEKQDACTYRALAAQTVGAARRCLLDIARQEAHHCRKLGAVYFILTGQRPCVADPTPPRSGGFCGELRTRYQEEMEGAAKYRKLAETAGSFRDVFLCLACEEEGHGRMILDLLT